MIREIEELMVHWGVQSREFGLGGGLGSQMGSIIEWGGAPPRGTPGSRILDGAGIGMDVIATEIDAAVAELERKGYGELAVLAIHRYCHLASVREQMRVVGIAEGADRTYRNWVQRLHQQVMLILVIRSGTTRGRAGQRQEGDHCKVTNHSGRRARV
ncbi:MAG: hypothetical protein ACOH2O_01265 [Pseudomonas sp.]